MRFNSKQIVTMVVAVSAAAALVPVGVVAATSFVSITDPVTDRRARVTAGGALQVESRSGVPAGAFDVQLTATSLESVTLATATAPRRVAVTEVTLGSFGPTSTTTGYHKVHLVSYEQTTGTGTCGTTSSGWTTETRRVFYVYNHASSVQMSWDGPPLVTAKLPDGKRSCFVLRVTTFTTSSTVEMGASGYTFL